MKNKLFTSNYLKNDIKLLLNKGKKFSLNIKTLKSKNNKEKNLFNSNIKPRIHNLIIDPSILLNTRSPNVKNIKTSLSLDNQNLFSKRYKSLSSKNEKENQIKNNDKKVKLIHKSKSVYDNLKLKNNNFLKNINKLVPLNSKYEYNKFLIYKKHHNNKINDKNRYTNEIREKYYIRGLALTRELVFYYHQCQRVDFSEKEDKNNRNKYFSNIVKSSLNNKLNYGKKIIKNNFEMKEINKLRLRKLRKNGLNIQYSLNNLINNKPPITILTK